MLLIHTRHGILSQHCTPKENMLEVNKSRGDSISQKKSTLVVQRSRNPMKIKTCFVTVAPKL